MGSKFKVGDRVMCTDNGKLGAVTEIDNDGYGCVVLFDDGEDTWIGCDMLELSDEPPYDPKTAFLSELKELLAKYDAEIYPYSDGWDGETGLSFNLGGKDKIDYPEEVLSKIGYVIAADNIMDYDKE